ncbi:MAG: hypothetical protein ACOCXT_02980, partial [Candidatus Dojkabacteria bacterium]
MDKKPSPIITGGNACSVLQKTAFGNSFQTYEYIQESIHIFARVRKNGYKRIMKLPRGKKVLISVVAAVFLLTSIIVAVIFLQNEDTEIRNQAQTTKYNRNHTPLNGVVKGGVVWSDKRDYSIGVHKSTGTIYKFINARSDENANTIHEHPGAALQIAIHQGGQLTPKDSACSSQGYWNPTQAGANCSFPIKWEHHAPELGKDTQLSCDGVQNNSCETANESIEQSQHRMMNFDYGEDYP